MQSDAATVEQHLSGLPEKRRAALETARGAILDTPPQGFEEAMNWEMITYQVSLAVYSDTYCGKPLIYAALASQKNHLEVYQTGIYLSKQVRREFEAAYKATGKRFDAGKSCLRFRRIDDLPLDLIGATIASLNIDEFAGQAETLDSSRKRCRK